MSFFKIQNLLCDRVISLYVKKECLVLKFEDLVFHSIDKILLFIGFSLITCGLLSLSFGEYDPEPLQAQNPEPIQAQNPEDVCCVEAYPEQLLVLPYPMQLLTFDAEQAANFVQAEQAPTLDAQNSVTKDAEGSATNDAEAGITQDAEGTLAQEAEALDANYDDTLFRFSAGNLLAFIEGAFGALIMVASGIGAIIAAGFGAYKASIALLFVAVGAFILRALVSLFFGTNYPAYGVDFVGGEGI